MKDSPANNKIQQPTLSGKRKYITAVFFAAVTLILYLLGWVI
jgi:hypothetical protein